MKTGTPNQKLFALTGLVLAILLIPAIAAAQPGYHKGQGPFGGGGPAGHRGPIGGPGPHMDGAFGQLDLSSQQRDDIHAIMDTQREEMRATGDAMRESRLALRNAIHAESYDEGAIREALAVVANAEEQAAFQRAAVFQEISRILTPEQQAEARELMEQRQEMFEERAEEGFRRGGGRRFQR